MLRQTQSSEIKLGADIGGTFTDIALDVRGQLYSTKVLTEHNALETAVLEGIHKVTRLAQISLQDIDQIIHGTTLATNALIERRGAKTAFITTEGFRDVIEMRTESRFDQYDLGIQLAPPLIARQHRYPVGGRIDAHGKVLQSLDEDAVEQLVATIRAEGFESVAIGFIHSYVNPVHEQRAREILTAKLPSISISISSEVSPQMREYPRFCTVCANAYVRPKIEQYLTRLQALLKSEGATCPVHMIHSAGGLISISTAKQFPVRLLESGPAGGVIYAADFAKKFGFDKVFSFDMGGTTAKICLIENGEPNTSREFEVARSHRFCKGSGMPISIPVIDMIEIGAGGGSIAWTDAMGRIQTGPQSAGSHPGPACYQRGGTHPTVTDADVVLGKIDPHHFAGGTIELSRDAASVAINQALTGEDFSNAVTAAFGICEVVDENMANAARVHAVENGRNIADNIMIAFGGAAPLHAARICEKLGIDRCLIPPGAGVGSAIGFLVAPFSFEAAVSRVMSLKHFDFEVANDILSELIQTAQNFARAGTRAEVKLEATAHMRYQGQGWEIPVPLTMHHLTASDLPELRRGFEGCYEELFGRTIDMVSDLDIEVVTWAVKAVEQRQAPPQVLDIEQTTPVAVANHQAIFDPVDEKMVTSNIVLRKHLTAGDQVAGPAVIIEPQTSTVVTSRFDAVVQNDGSIMLSRKPE